MPRLVHPCESDEVSSAIDYSNANCDANLDRACPGGVEDPLAVT
jgi:hypothetical protein